MYLNWLRYEHYTVISEKKANQCKKIHALEWCIIEHNNTDKMQLIQVMSSYHLLCKRKRQFNIHASKDQGMKIFKAVRK